MLAQKQLEDSLSPIWHLLDSDIQELMINGENDIWVEMKGKLTRVDIPLSKQSIESAIHLLGRMNEKDVKAKNGDSVIDARIPGFRIAACIHPISVRGPSICIRKHNPIVLTLEDYIKQGALTEDDCDLLRDIVRQHKNILIVGGTSSGKTTFFNALIKEIDPSERILTIEDTQELQVVSPNWVALEANHQKGISARELLKLSLRYRPDRILVGEVRGGEAYDLMQAANTGHDGVMATLHASSAAKGLSRLENLIMTADLNLPSHAIRHQIADTFNYVIFLARRNGRRGIEQLLEINGYDQQQHKYVYNLLIDRKAFQ